MRVEKLLAATCFCGSKTEAWHVSEVKRVSWNFGILSLITHCQLVWETVTANDDLILIFPLSLSFVIDSFVNSQEWTISRSVPDLRLGIVGSLNSGKSALVHRYLTGSYMQEESPEGGRFKKEFFIDGQSYLLLIRDEGGAPEMQVRTHS